MRVLHVITGLASGGAEHQLRLLLRHRTHEAEVAVLTNPGVLATTIRSEGTTVHEIDMRNNRDFAAMPRLVRLMRQGRFDIVHTHLYRAMLHGRVAARLAGVRTVLATEHSLGDGMIEGRRFNPGIQGMYLATERLGNLTVAVSETVVRRLVAWGVSRRRIVMIPNGMDVMQFTYDPTARDELRRRYAIAKNAFVVGAVGRLVPEKRFDVLMQAVSRVPEVTLLLVGGGKAETALRELAEATGIADRTVFTGESTEVPSMLSAMDLLASPSQGETFGLNVLEALASGIPALYVQCPAIAELSPQDAPGAQQVGPSADAFAAAIAEMAQQGQVRMEPPPAVAQYDIANVAGVLDDLYARLATRHRSSRR